MLFGKPPSNFRAKFYQFFSEFPDLASKTFSNGVCIPGERTEYRHALYIDNPK